MSEERMCQNCKRDFTIESEDFNFYEKLDVPAPTFCPECRLIRRLCWRNERSLYKRTCGKTGKKIISVFSDDKPYTVYESTEWWKDDWDAMDYGHEYNADKNFFIQLDDLLHKVPMMSLYGLFATVENSPFVNMAAHIKNCYMSIYCDYSENILYGSFVNHSKDSADSLMLNKCELCYESVNCVGCYDTLYSVDCESCHSVLFCKDCVGCSDCFGCAGLRNKQYYIWNKPHTKEEYEQWILNNRPQTFTQFQEVRKKAVEHWNEFPVKYYHGSHNQDVSGDYVYHSKNAHHMYNVANVEDSKWCFYVTPTEGGLKDSYDFTSFGVSSERLYESLQVGDQTSDILFSWLVISNAYKNEYCISCVGTKHCFGCVGLKKKEYCVLNKQYTKEEYFKLRDQIISDMNKNPYTDSKGREYRYGEFLPQDLSPFGYNEASSQEFFPIEKEEAIQKGYTWYDKSDSKHTPTILWEDVPERISDVDEDVLEHVFACIKTGKAFRIVKQELDFLRRLKLPLPRLHPDVRHSERAHFRNQPKLYRRTTDDGVEVMTPYSPDRPEKILSEEGYKREIL